MVYLLSLTLVIPTLIGVRNGLWTCFYMILYMFSHIWGCDIIFSSVKTVLFIILLRFKNLQVCDENVCVMLVLFCVLPVFSGVLWSFLYEYICKYLLFISLYRSEMVLIIRVCLYVYVVYFLFASVTMSSSACYLFVFTEARWSFLWKDAIKCMLYISLYRGEIVLFLFVCICYLFLFTEVRWSFLCEYVCMCMLYIALYRGEIVFICEYVCKCVLFISLCKCEMVLFMWVCLYVYVVYFSLQRWDSPFFVCMYMLFISLYRGERVPFMWLCL